MLALAAVWRADQPPSALPGCLQSGQTRRDPQHAPAACSNSSSQARAWVMTKCSRLVLRSVPLTSASLSRVSSLKPAAAPRWVPCGEAGGAGGEGASQGRCMVVGGLQAQPRAEKGGGSSSGRESPGRRAGTPPGASAAAQPPRSTHLVQVVAQLQHRLQQLGEGRATLQLAAGGAHHLQLVHALRAGRAAGTAQHARVQNQCLQGCAAAKPQNPPPAHGGLRLKAGAAEGGCG